MSDSVLSITIPIHLSPCLQPEVSANALVKDLIKVSGSKAVLTSDAGLKDKDAAGKPTILVGTIGHSAAIDQLIRQKHINGNLLKGKREKFIITVVDGQLVIAGSDRRGTIYGIYELSQQMGVSPWYDWADVPVVHHDSIFVNKGVYTDGEPAVRYRGIFLNDEAPCLTSWVKNTYGTDYGDHRFYQRVFELILRLRGNMMWPAMWGWAFYADDPENEKTADEMGVVMSTSHHEPMARNHQEYARNHTAADFRKYIEDHQVDFIQFKTDLMLRGVTDPVKRSQAINSIVESISKIKNQITRASYITDCAHRLGVNEAIIVNALNNFVRNGMSEQVKAERRAAGLRDPKATSPQQGMQQALQGTTPLDKLLEVETLLVQVVIHHGDKTIVVQDVDGNNVELPVAQYISLDLAGDNFKFHNELYNQILQEAVEHVEEEGFVAENYFANHPNPEISRIAGLPTGDQEVSTVSLQLKMSQEKLRQLVFKDLLSFRTHYIAQRIIEVQQEFARNPTNRELLEEFMKLKKMNILLASQTNSVFN